MVSVSSRGLARSLGVIALLMAALMGCSDDSSTVGQGDPVELRGLLPAATRGFLAMDFGENSPLRAASFFEERATVPWRHTPEDLFTFYASGLNLANVARELVFAQITPSGIEFVLLFGVNPQDIHTVTDRLEITAAASYRGVEIDDITANGLSIAKLTESQWAIATRVTLESVIDVYEGDAAGLEASLLADHLPAPSDTEGASFIYGLPALYAQTTSPGTGEVSINAATIVRGALGTAELADTLRIDIVTPNAVTYAERFNALMPVGTARPVTAQEDLLIADIQGPEYFEHTLSLLKSLVSGMNAVDYADAVNDPGNPPWLNFDVGENPNSIFINFEFTGEESRQAFTAQHLPEGFRLAPLRILDNEEPRYFLVLNVYQSSGGLVEGARAEWSVFVQDPDTQVPRFLVIQAAAETFSADSVNGFTAPEPVNHLLTSDSISSYVGVVDEATEQEALYFASTLVWPQTPEELVRFSREFVVANDYIFWGNAVADRGLYNSSVHNRSAVRIDNAQLQIDDRSLWAEFVQAAPVHTLVYRNPLEIVISPWWNLDAPYLDVTEAYRQELLDFKNAFYPGTVIANAEAAMRGERPALTPFSLGEETPTTYYHFDIVDLPGLLNSIGGSSAPDPASVIAIALHEGDEPGYYLTLALAQRVADTCGVHAQWNLYVRNDQGNPQTLQIETLSSDACVDPVSLIGLSAAIAHESSNDQLRTQIATPFISVDMQTNLSMAENVTPSADWVEAGDQLCSVNGVCDLVFYDGKTLSETLLRVDAAAVTVGAVRTPWDGFISTAPSQVTVRIGTALMAENSWIDVPVYGAGGQQ